MMRDQRVERGLARLLSEKTGLPIEKPENCTCQYPVVVARNMCGHAPDCPVYIEWAQGVYVTRQPNESVLDCRSEEGITVSLIDALIAIGRVLARRDLGSSGHVKEALKDLALDADIQLILASAEAAFDEDGKHTEDENGH